MGSLALAGVIGGAGKGMQANVARENLNEQNELDRMRDEMLQSMRDESGMARVEKTQEYATTNYDTMRKDTLADLEAKHKYEQGLVLGTQKREDEVREDEQEHNIDIKAMDAWQKRTESTSYTTKDGKWEMKVLARGEIGPNGLPVEIDTFVVREPGTPFSFEQHGLNMLPHNYTDEEREKALAIANSGDESLQKAKADLMGKAGTDKDDSSVFMDAYGFLPAAYFRKIRSSEEGSGSAYQEYRKSFRQPAGGSAPPISQAPTPVPSAAPAPAPMPAPAPGGMLSEAESMGPPAPAVAPAEQKGPPAPPVAAETAEPEKYIPALHTLANPDRFGSGGRALMQLIHEKPWIKNIVSRYKMGLSISPEEVAQVEAFLNERQIAGR